MIFFRPFRIQQTRVTASGSASNQAEEKGRKERGCGDWRVNRKGEERAWGEIYFTTAPDYSVGHENGKDSSDVFCVSERKQSVDFTRWSEDHKYLHARFILVHITQQAP